MECARISFAGAKPGEENMGDKKYPVITISREYAAYGRTVARGLSEALGIPFYDKDFVRMTAEKSGYSEEEIKLEGERMSRASRFLNGLLNNAMVYNSSYDGIFNAQKEVVLELAEKGPCIIVGRCADDILTEADVPVFKVFLYADMKHRIVRASELDENAGRDPKKAIEKRDILRSTYYKQYTGKEFGDYKNFNICLDTGAIGTDKCVEILVGLFK